MIQLGVVQQDSTIYIPFATRDGSGGAIGFSATIEVADFDIYKNGSAVQRSSTSGFTISETFDTITGAHMLSIDLSDNTDAGFYSAGDVFHVLATPDETVDGQTVAEWIATFTIESNADRAARLYRTYLFAESTIATVTSNSTTLINMTDILDAQTPDDAINGTVWAVRDATDGGIEYVVVTDFVNSTMLATVEQLADSSAMTFT